ncbi:MAG: AAA family ATPase [Rhodothermia bacterium]|nr:AAA family ATPase [Rhodothermia bacterium]
MRIISCHIEQFGTLEERTFADLDHALVVLLGPNEAGKSTFFEFLKTMLFGFSPANAAKHPYRPDSGRLSGSMAFVAGKTACSLERSLRSTPRGQLNVGMDGLFGRKEDLRNRPIPELAPVSRDLFEAVYALSLADMVRIEGKAWDTIQDRLLGGLNIEQVRNPREVAAELDREAGRLWRTDRRGKARSAELREDVRSIRGQIREARDRDLEARRLSEEVDTMTARKSELESQLQEDRAAIRTTDRLIPVKQGLQQITRLEEQAGDLSTYAMIPPEPALTLNRLREEKDRLKAEVRTRLGTLDRLRSTSEAFDDAAKEAVRHASEIRSLQSRSGIMVERQAQLDDLKRRVDERRLALDEMWNRVMPVAQDAVARRSVGSFPVDDVRVSLAELKSLLDRRTRAADRKEYREESVAVAPWTIVFLLGVVVAIIGFLVGRSLVWGPALVFASAGAALLLQAIASNRRLARADATGPVNHVAEIDLEIEKSRTRIAEKLRFLGVDFDERFEKTAELVEGVQELQTLLTRIAADETESARLADLVGMEEDRGVSVAKTMSIDSSLPAERLVRLLADMLERAEEKRLAAAHASAQIDEEEAAASERQQRLECVVQELQIIESALEQLGEGDPDKGSLVLEERRSLSRRASSIREELETRHLDLATLKEEISSLNGAVVLTDKARVQLDSRIEETRAEIASLVESIAEREARVSALRSLPTVAELESEVEVLEGEIRSAEEERDRLVLLANLMREADESFREKHQPDVVKRASMMLAALTGGRYDRLELTEDNDGQLMVHDAHRRRITPVGPPLSRGTLDQIYLTLRFAIADHLDDPSDPLPLFLDEVLVNWDEERRKRGLQLIADIAESRQVFFFTCHDWMAAELERSAGGHVVSL